MSAFPELGLFSPQSSAFLIWSVVVPHVRSVVTGEDYQGIVDQFMSRVTGIVRLAKGLEQCPKSDVVFQYHVLAVVSLGAIRVPALSLDSSACNGLGHSVGPSCVLL